MSKKKEPNSPYSTGKEKEDESRINKAVRKNLPEELRKRFDEFVKRDGDKKQK